MRIYRVLLVGSFASMLSDPDVSGTVISLKQLVAELEARPDISLRVVNTEGVRSSRFLLWGTCKTAFRIFRESIGADALFLNLSPDGFSGLCLPSVITAKILRIPLIFRMFGGRDIWHLKGIRQKVSAWALRYVDVYFAQTRELIASAESRGYRNVRWFPTTRPMPDFGGNNPYSGVGGPYVMMAQLKPEKGIFELIEAAKRLGPSYHFHVYGPFYFGLDASIFEGVPNVEYKGVAKPGEVLGILKRCKALVFPTYLYQEGYSGIVIEAYSVGLPVLCTRWKALPEIVDERSGILFEPRSVESLCEAIRTFEANPTLQKRLSEGAFARRNEFSIESAVNRVVSTLGEVVMNDQ